MQVNTYTRNTMVIPYVHNTIRFVDVAQSMCRVCRDDIVILYGDDSVAHYCYEFNRALKRDAAVVAVAHGLDITEDAGDSQVVYSRLNKFKEGTLIREQLGQICRLTPDENTLRNVNGSYPVGLPENGGKSFLLSKDSPIFEKEIGRRVNVVF